MNRIAMFEKVSFEQFVNDVIHTFGDLNPYTKDEATIRTIYDNIKLPTRATKGSAGYDIYSPFPELIKVGNSINIPTGIRCQMNRNYVLIIAPRSGMGFKSGIHLANTIGIIDSDYYRAKNEGHIFVKLVNDSAIAYDVKIDTDKAICQGLFLQYGVTIDDETDADRIGGFGSTDKIENNNVEVGALNDNR